MRILSMYFLLAITQLIFSSADAAKSVNETEPIIQTVNINGAPALLLGFHADMNSEDYLSMAETQAAMESALYLGNYDVLTQVQDGRQLLELERGSFSYQFNPIAGTLDISSGSLAMFAEQSQAAESKHLLRLSSAQGLVPELWLHFFVQHPERRLEPTINGRPFAFDSVTATLEGQAVAEANLFAFLSQSQSFTLEIIQARIDEYEIPQGEIEVTLNHGQFYIQGLVDAGLFPEFEVEIFIDGELDGHVFEIKWIRKFPPDVIRYDDGGLGDQSGPGGIFSPFVLHGNAWDCGNITFSFANGTPDIADDLEHAAVRWAFEVWGSEVNINFVEIGNPDNADIVVLWGAGNHGIADPLDPDFDGINGVLAHAAFPPPLALNDPTLAGDVHFDEDENWTLAFQNTNNQPIDMLTVALHEIGHALGLRHSPVPGAIMQPFYGGSQRFLGTDDIAGINAIYGDCPARIRSLHYSGNANGQVSLLPPNDDTLTADDLTLLNIFNFRFDSDDHHLERIAVLSPIVLPDGSTSNGQVAYHDDNEDDLFSYIADWKVFLDPSNTVFEQSKSCHGQCTIDLTNFRPSPEHVFVLSGFDFSFENCDHHIDEIEIMEENGVLTVAYNDKNDDDPFFVSVEFAYLPPWYVVDIVNVQSTSVAGSDTRLTGMTNTTAIAGFHFDFLDDDHHIRKIAVDTSAPEFVEVSYFDKNADDNYSWLVRVVELVE